MSCWSDLEHDTIRAPVERLLIKHRINDHTENSNKDRPLSILAYILCPDVFGRLSVKRRMVIKTIAITNVKHCSSRLIF